MFALVFALFTVNSLTAAAGIGISLDSGGLSRDDVNAVSGELEQPRAVAVGQQDPGFLGIAVGTARTVNQLWTITTNLHGILTSWGVPLPIAVGAQAMVNLTMAVTALQVLKEFRL